MTPGWNTIVVESVGTSSTMKPSYVDAGDSCEGIELLDSAHTHAAGDVISGVVTPDSRTAENESGVNMAVYCATFTPGKISTRMGNARIDPNSGWYCVVEHSDAGIGAPTTNSTSQGNPPPLSQPRPARSSNALTLFPLGLSPVFAAAEEEVDDSEVAACCVGRSSSAVVCPSDEHPTANRKLATPTATTLFFKRPSSSTALRGHFEFLDSLKHQKLRVGGASNRPARRNFRIERNGAARWSIDRYQCVRQASRVRRRSRVGMPDR